MFVPEVRLGAVGYAGMFRAKLLLLACSRPRKHSETMSPQSAKRFDSCFARFRHTHTHRKLLLWRSTCLTSPSCLSDSLAERLGLDLRFLLIQGPQTHWMRLRAIGAIGTNCSIDHCEQHTCTSSTSSETKKPCEELLMFLTPNSSSIGVGLTAKCKK